MMNRLLLPARGFHQHPARPWHAVLTSGSGWLFALVVALSVEAAQPAAVPAPKPAGSTSPETCRKNRPWGRLCRPRRRRRKRKRTSPPPAPKTVWLETTDMWRIHCLYYAPKEDVRDGKEVVPIIMLHGWGGQGGEYSFLAVGLQTLWLRRDGSGLARTRAQCWPQEVGWRLLDGQV